MVFCILELALMILNDFDKEIKMIALLCVEILERCSSIGFNAEEMLRNELNERYENAKRS